MANEAPQELSDELREHLARHDVMCPTCGYNLRGLTSGACPECGVAVPAWVVPSAHDPDDRRLTAMYLRDHDLICRHCKSNLRGSPDGVCPGCGRIYLVKGVPRPEGFQQRGTPSWGGMVALGVLGLLLLVIVMIVELFSP